MSAHGKYIIYRSKPTDTTTPSPISMDAIIIVCTMDEAICIKLGRRGLNTYVRFFSRWMNSWISVWFLRVAPSHGRAPTDRRRLFILLIRVYIINYYSSARIILLCIPTTFPASPLVNSRRRRHRCIIYSVPGTYIYVVAGIIWA